MAIECWVYISQSDLAREKLWSVAVAQCLNIAKNVSLFSCKTCILLKNWISNKIIKLRLFWDIFKHSALEVMMKKEEMHNKKPHEFSNITFFFFSTLKLHGEEKEFFPCTYFLGQQNLCKKKELKCKIPTCFTENLSLQTRLIAEVKH